MKVRSLLTGKVVVFVNIDELLPERGAHAPEAISGLAGRYTFAVRPQLTEAIQTVREKGMRFEIGKFKLPTGEERPIQDFTAWNDGLVVTAFSTEDAEGFLEDFLSWGKEAIGLRLDLAALRLRTYLSQVVVEFDKSLTQRLSIFQPLCQMLNGALAETYGSAFPPSEPVEISFDYDHSVAPAAFKMLGGLRIERREGHRFAEDNVYFSAAPLRTSDHIRLLMRFEQSLDPEFRWESAKSN